MPKHASITSNSNSNHRIESQSKNQTLKGQMRELEKQLDEAKKAGAKATAECDAAHPEA